jgi:flavin reductase (DIM6/NTAB) family NADH-FMN oxidoreductase RutF
MSNGSNSLEPNQQEWTAFDPSQMQSGDVYRLALSALVPRPVAVITSISPDGIINCAPFSYTGLLSHDPPMVCHGLALTNNGTKKKDTLMNIESTKQWVFNVLSDHILDEVNQCSASYASDINEMEETGLTAIASEVVKAPRIAQAKVAMECELESTKELINSKGIHTTTIVFGKVIRFHIHHSVLKTDEDGKSIVDLEKLRAVGRAGDISYWPAGEGNVVKLERPK